MFIECLHNSPHMVSEYMSRICLRNIYDLATHRTIFLVHIDAFFSTTVFRQTIATLKTMSYHDANFVVPGGTVSHIF